MKIPYGWLKSACCAALLITLTSCASYMPTGNSVGDMSVKEARKVVATALKNSGYTEVRFTSKKMIASGLSYKGHVYNPARITFNEQTQIVQSGSNENIVTVLDQNQFYISINPRAFTDALYLLKLNSIQQQKEDDEFNANFSLSLPDNRSKAASNTALPEEANKFKVQAEGSVRDKEFNDAADYYAKALRIAPWWPIGHFNRALVLGETGDYESAKREMNYYLQLVPDAANVRAAQDKIYEWERLESK